VAILSLRGFRTILPFASSLRKIATPNWSCYFASNCLRSYICCNVTWYPNSTWNSRV